MLVAPDETTTETRGERRISPTIYVVATDLFVTETRVIPETDACSLRFGGSDL